MAKLLRDRYSAGFKIGSTSDPSRPISLEDYIVVEDRSELEMKNKVRVAKVDDLIADFVGKSQNCSLTVQFTLNGSNYELTFVNGLLTNYSKT